MNRNVPIECVAYLVFIFLVKGTISEEQIIGASICYTLHVANSTCAFFMASWRCISFSLVSYWRC